jgi:hypothetical protein
MEAHARADANLELAWLNAEAAERKAREAAGAAPVDADAARRARRKSSRPLVRGRGVGVGWGVGRSLGAGGLRGRCSWAALDCARAWQRPRASPAEREPLLKGR